MSNLALIQVETWIREAAANSSSQQAADPPREISIPVRYGGDDGPDIDDVARLCNLGSASDVPARALGQNQIEN